MTIETIFVWFRMGNVASKSVGAERDKASDSGSRLAVALKMFDEASERNAKVNEEFMGALAQNREESAMAADLAKAALECYCPPEEKVK